MILDEAIERYTSNAEYERTHGSLQGCLEFRQLAEWLKELKAYREQEPCEDANANQHNSNALNDVGQHINALEVDALSRQAVNILVDELARAISDERCCISRGRSTATIMQDILDLPPVKPQEPKTGHWIKYGKLYQCSECKELSCCQGKFCNECGCPMEIDIDGMASDKLTTEDGEPDGVGQFFCP